MAGKAPEVAVVGAGPAGETAAATLTAAGWRVTLLDEQPRTGGNVDRVAVDAPPTALERLAAGSGRLELISGARVLRVGADRTVEYEHEGLRRSRFDTVILACGAYDLHTPLPGAPAPGVSSAGALQALLKGQRVVPGGKVVIAGAGPFPYVAAAGLHAAGARVAAVVDGLTWRDYAGLLPGGLGIPGNALELARVRGRLLRGGVRVIAGRRPAAVDGGRLVLDDGRELPFDCLGFTDRFVAQTQLARTAGCRQRWHGVGGYFVTDTDACGRTSVPGVLVCGEGQGVRGWRHARVSGELAALAAMADAGVEVPGDRCRRLLRRRSRLARFGEALEAALRRREPAPPAEAILCACEGVATATVTEAVALGLRDLSSVKVVTRCGMGPCQGRYCEGLVGRCIEAAGHVPGPALSQRGLTRPVPAGELADVP